MLLVHHQASVKVGEVFRYTVTYTPALDNVLPCPEHFCVIVRNLAALPLRAAYLHGPYALYVAAYPSTFNPHAKLQDHHTVGVPTFEPNLKAGGTWIKDLAIPAHVRQSRNTRSTENASLSASTTSTRHGEAKKKPQNVTWIIEIASQVLFSGSATVNFDIILARNEKFLDLGFSLLGKKVPGSNENRPTSSVGKEQGNRSEARLGVYSKAIDMQIEDTAALWNKPSLTCKQSKAVVDREVSNDADEALSATEPPTKIRKIHLVVLTHGLHGNTGSDMLYLKESIDAAVKEAREDRKKQREKLRERRKASVSNGTADPSNQEAKTASDQDGDHEAVENRTAGEAGVKSTHANDANDDDDDEEVIVRGYHGNVIRTEKGIQYLGKRLARYVLQVTYPDQPFLPIKKTIRKQMTRHFSTERPEHDDQSNPADNSHPYTTAETSRTGGRSAYKYTSISFVGHSLGGITQTYAIAYIQKHSPDFFTHIKPVNFITLASPFLGLSNENPIYVKFALDFGLVGRTGQDLGLLLRAPAVARTGWSAVIGGLGVGSTEQSQQKTLSKPLLRILPTGPAHQALKLFRNRTLYSNVVNDGIVPLRTGCLLFLDWRGLGRVQKARRGNGLIGTMAGWGWAELTGASSASKAALSDEEGLTDSDGAMTPTKPGSGSVVPQPPEGITMADNAEATYNAGTDSHAHVSSTDKKDRSSVDHGLDSDNILGPLTVLLSFLRPTGKTTTKDYRMYRRSQTVKLASDDAQSGTETPDGKPPSRLPNPAEDPLDAPRDGPLALKDAENVHAPPKTTVFESAGDILNPPLPPMQWLIDPACRPRTIFHDRVYHPGDIPEPRAKHSAQHHHPTTGASGSGPDQHSKHETEPEHELEPMKVEEKIARAYHRDLSWRKVLVRLEPDAHNNIIVRRMFANAYGWPVIKHLCDTHFANTVTAATRDEDEPTTDRVEDTTARVSKTGEEVVGQTEEYHLEASDASHGSDAASDGNKVKAIEHKAPLTKHLNTRTVLTREHSEMWDDRYFGETTDTDDDDDDRKSEDEDHANIRDSRRLAKGVPETPTKQHTGRRPDMACQDDGSHSDPEHLPGLDLERTLTARKIAPVAKEAP